ITIMFWAIQDLSYSGSGGGITSAPKSRHQKAGREQCAHLLAPCDQTRSEILDTYIFIHFIKLYYILLHFFTFYTPHPILLAQACERADILKRQSRGLRRLLTIRSVG